MEDQCHVIIILKLKIENETSEVIGKYKIFQVNWFHVLIYLHLSIQLNIDTNIFT